MVKKKINPCSMFAKISRAPKVPNPREPLLHIGNQKEQHSLEQLCAGKQGDGAWGSARAALGWATAGAEMRRAARGGPGPAGRTGSGPTRTAPPRHRHNHGVRGTRGTRRRRGAGGRPPRALTEGQRRRPAQHVPRHGRGAGNASRAG